MLFLEYLPQEKYTLSINVAGRRGRDRMVV